MRKQTKSKVKGIADIKTYAWDYSRAADGDFVGTFDAIPTYLVLLDIFNELLAPLSEAASKAKKESLSLDEAKAKLKAERSIEISKCISHAQDIVIETFGSVLVSCVRGLTRDAVVRTLSDLTNEISIAVPPRGKLAEIVLKEIAVAYKEQLQVQWGGARKKKPTVPGSTRKSKKLARDVDAVSAAWKLITAFFRDQGYSADSIEAIKGKDFFKKLHQEHPVPGDLLHEVFRRAQSNDRQYSPKALAMKHIYREIYPKKKTPPYGTLKNLYLKGCRLNGQRRSAS